MPLVSCPIVFLDGGLGTTLTSHFGVDFAVASSSSSSLLPSDGQTTSPISTRATSAAGLWSAGLLLSAPETLTALHARFLAAGSDVLLTATYQLSYEGLARAGVDRAQAGCIMARGVEVAVRAVRALKGGEGEGKEIERGNRRIALSLGPYGATMLPTSQEYTGRYDAAHATMSALARWHGDRLAGYRAALSAPASTSPPWDDVSILAFETLPLAREIIAVRRAMHAHALKPFWVTCVFPGEMAEGSAGTLGLTLPDGTSAEDVVQAMVGEKGELQGAQDGTAVADDGVPLEMATPFGIGINCTSIQKLDRLVRAFERGLAALSGPSSAAAAAPQYTLLLYPDGTRPGEVYNTVTRAWERGDAEGDTREAWHEMLGKVAHDAVARGCWREIWLGGCCLVDPGDISLLRGFMGRG